MGLDPLTVGVIVGGVLSAAGTGASIVAGNKARASQRHAADEQEQAQEQQNAQIAQKAADERRQQFREERIRRARIEQSAVNTGTEGSSGELGALASLSTQLNTNLGASQAAQDRGQAISLFNQNAATSLSDARNDLSAGATINSIFQTGAGIAGTYTKAGSKAKVTSGGTYDSSFDNPSDYG